MSVCCQWPLGVYEYSIDILVPLFDLGSIIWGRPRDSAASEEEFQAFVIKWPRGFHQLLENVLGQAIPPK